jgi:hypothetical protein
VQLKQTSTPARPAFDPEGGGGRAELGEGCRIYTGALRPLDPLVGGGVVLGRACLTHHATLAPREGGGGWARVESWVRPLTMNVDWLLTNVDWLLTNVEWLLTNVDWLLSNVDWLLTNVDWLLRSQSVASHLPGNVQVSHTTDFFTVSRNQQASCSS